MKPRAGDPGDRVIWEQLTEAQRLVLMSVSVLNGMAVWRAGTQKTTIRALRDCGLLHDIGAEAQGLTDRGARVKAIGVACGYSDGARHG